MKLFTEPSDNMVRSALVFLSALSPQPSALLRS